MILIVDDNQENIFSLKSLLSLHHFEVDSATSGEEALKKILTNSYALVILDVQMPEMDGFEVAEAISGYSKSRDIPIIFLSAVNIHKKFVTKGYASGGIDYVTKPFDPDILLLKIKTFYRLSEQTQQLNAMEKSLRHEIELRKVAESILENKVEERTSQLRKANLRLEESNRELQQFAFIASHDLQEPLRKIQTFSNIALEKHIRDEEKLASYLQKISSSATRLRNLINDLLDYSRIYIEYKFVPTDLNKLISDVLSDLEVHEDKCSIKVDTLPEIDAIPTQMSQVFLNLIGNSLKFSRQDVPCKIHVTGESVLERSVDSPASPDGAFARITVRDNGIGFSNEFRERVFDIFQRLNPTKVYEGTGIGLSIVKKVIERHDGLIAADSHENEGSTFTIVLPVKHKVNNQQLLPE
jgi:signal transduction histidine kinase